MGFNKRLFQDAAETCTSSNLDHPVSGTALYQMENNGNSTSSSSYNATSTPSVNFDSSEKKFGSYSASFNGSSSKIILSANDFHLSAFTITAWVRVSSYPSSGNYNIMNTYDYVGGPSRGWNVYIDTNGKLTFAGHSGDCASPYPTDASCTAYTRIIASNAVPTNTWTFVACTNAGTGGAVTLYKGATSEATTTMQGLAYHTGHVTTIGYAQYSVGGTSYDANFFNGHIDQLRVYNSALSASNIATLASESC